MQAYYRLTLTVFLLLATQIQAVFAAPISLKSLSIAINSTIDRDHQWRLIPKAQNTDHKDLMMLSVPVSDYISGLHTYPVRDQLCFTLNHRLQSNPSKEESYTIMFSWNADKKHYLVQEDHLTSREGKLYQLKSSFLPTAYSHTAGRDAELTSAALMLYIMELEYSAPLQTTMPGNTGKDDKIAEEEIAGTNEIDGLFQSPPLFRIVLINNPDDVLHSRKFFALRSARMWPDYIDGETSQIPNSSRIKRRKLLSDLCYKSESFPLFSNENNLHNADVTLQEACLITQISGSTTRIAQMTGGNEISVIIEQVQQEGFDAGRRQSNVQHDYLKLRIKHGSLEVLEGGAGRFVKKYVFIEENDMGKPLLTLALTMKNADEVPISFANKSQLMPSTIDDTDGPQKTEKNHKPLFPETAKEMNDYMKAMGDFFSYGGVPF